MINSIFQDIWSFHFWNGIKNKYPLCCILWFCNTVTNFGKQSNSLFEKIFSVEFDSVTEKQANFSDRSMCLECTIEALHSESKSQITDNGSEK